MPRNLYYYRKECENLLARFSDDPHAQDVFEAAIEACWSDQVSLEEIAEEMRHELRFN